MKFVAILLYATILFRLCCSVTCFKLITDTALQQGHLILIMPADAAPQSNNRLLEQLGQCTCISSSVDFIHTPPRNFRVLFNKSFGNLFHRFHGSDELIIYRTFVCVNKYFNFQVLHLVLAFAVVL